MTSGSRLEMVGSSRSVRGFHGGRACSGVFLVMRWTMLENVLEGHCPMGPAFLGGQAFLSGG
jgi:hypothetical protein